MTWEQLTWEVLTWEVITWNQNMFWSPESIWSAITFYKQLLVWILPLLKQIWFWLLVVLVVFIVLLIIFNFIASKWRKKIQLQDKKFRWVYDEENDNDVQKENQTSNDSAVDHWWDN